MTDREWAYAKFSSYSEQLANSGHVFRVDLSLNTTATTYEDAVLDLPRTLIAWTNSKARVLKAKAIMTNWQLDYAWCNWNYSSTQLMKFHTPAKSLDRSILDYQLDRILNEKNPTYCAPISGEGTLGRDTIWDYTYPINMGTWAVLYATRLLYYDINWVSDSGWTKVEREIDSLTGVVLSCGYTCEKTFGKGGLA